MGADTSFNQHPGQHSPTPTGFHQIVEHRRPVIVVASDGTPEVAKNIHQLQRDSVSRDDSVGRGVGHGLEFAALNQLLALHAGVGFHVAAPIHGAVGDVHVALLAARQRLVPLLTHTNAVLVVASIEVKTHAMRSAGSARTVWNRAGDILLVPRREPGDTSIIHHRRGVRDRRWEDRRANAILLQAMGAKGGKMKHGRALRAGHLAALAFAMALAFASHSSLVGSIRHASRFDCRQANHELGLEVVGLEPDAFEQSHQEIQDLLQPLSVLGGKQTIVSIEQGEHVLHSPAQTIGWH